VFADVAFWIWGGNPVMLPQPALFSGTVRVFGIPYPTYRLFLIGVGLSLALLLWLFLENTKIGAAVRAGIDDEEMLRGIGVDVTLLFACVVALGAGLAALGGVRGLRGRAPCLRGRDRGRARQHPGRVLGEPARWTRRQFRECLVSAAIVVHDFSADDC